MYTTHIHVKFHLSNSNSLEGEPTMDEHEETPRLPRREASMEPSKHKEACSKNLFQVLNKQYVSEVN